MKLEGSQTIAADRATVWAALNDPDVLRQCIPGCQSMDQEDDTHFSAVVKQKIGPVSATFNGSVELQDLNPPESYTIAGEGKGGAAGFAKGSAAVRLSDVEEGTQLDYDVEAKVGGKLAQLGARLIHGVAKQQSEAFFSKFKEVVEGPQEAEAEAGAPEQAAQPSEPEAEPATAEAPAGAAKESKGFWKKLWG